MARSTFLVALLAAAIVTTTVAQDDDPDEGVCDPGWTKFEKKCYFYNTHQTTADCAESICERSGGHLASIETKEQQDFIMNLVKIDGCANPGRFWIGYTDIDREGTFVWYSSNKHGSINNFRSDQPDNYNNEDCAEVFISTGKWNDAQCNRDKRCYVCEKGLFIPFDFNQ